MKPLFFFHVKNPVKMSVLFCLYVKKLKLWRHILHKMMWKNAPAQIYFQQSGPRNEN